MALPAMTRRNAADRALFWDMLSFQISQRSLLIRMVPIGSSSFSVLLHPLNPFQLSNACALRKDACSRNAAEITSHLGASNISLSHPGIRLIFPTNLANPWHQFVSFL